MKQNKLDALLLPATVALVLVFDQVTKYFVTSRLGEGQSWEIIPWLAPIFHLTHVTNTGAVFGMFPGGGNLFIVVSVIVIVVLLLYYRQMPDGQGLVRLALGLQLGGAVGNLIDRLRQGYVVDFVDLNYWPMRNWAVFNVADTSIITGVVLLTLVMLWEEFREQRLQRAAVDG